MSILSELSFVIIKIVKITKTITCDNRGMRKGLEINPCGSSLKVFQAWSELHLTTLNTRQNFAVIRLINHIDVSVRLKWGCRNIWQDKIAIDPLCRTNKANVVLQIIQALLSINNSVVLTGTNFYTQLSTNLLNSIYIHKKTSRSSGIYLQNPPNQIGSMRFSHCVPLCILTLEMLKQLLCFWDSE